MSTAAATWGISRLVGTAPTWPPPSPPVAITASMPHPATFSACLRAPTEAIVITPASLSAAISSGFGACANEATGTCRATMSRDPFGRIGRVGAQVHPERRVGPPGGLGDGAFQLGQAHRGRRDQAQAPGVGRRRGQPRPGHVAHRGLHDRGSGCPAVRSAGSGLRSPPVAHGSSRSRAPPGSSRVRIRSSSAAVGHRVTGTSSGNDEREAGRRHHLADLDPRMDRTQPHHASAVPGRPEVEHRQVRHHHAQLVRHGPAVVADAADHVHARPTKTRGECRGTQ